MSCINPVSTPLPQILWRPFFFILWIQKEFSPLLPLRLDWMFLNILPNSAPLFSFSAFLMEISLNTSNITSILLELDPSCSAKLHVGHLSKHLVVSFESLYKGHSIYYKCWWLLEHFFFNSFAKAAFFVFLNAPSAVDNAQERGPSGWLRTSLI